MSEDKVPQLDAELVMEFVGVAHGNLERVKELEAETPALVNATWDWGGGDWESGLGSAAHTASKEIALFLLERGARMDVFCAAMLGKMEIVKAFVADDPSVVNLKGPHGIPLLQHAVIAEQKEIEAFLKEKGAEG